jgi:hypothetical protein
MGEKIAVFREVVRGTRRMGARPCTAATKATALQFSKALQEELTRGKAACPR